MMLSIIIPTLNEADTIQSTLMPLQNMRQRKHEVLLVDGGSSDDTVKLAAPLVDKIIQSPKGRAVQMNAGSQRASGDVLWFLHSDTFAPGCADNLIEQFINKTNKRWGRFNIRLTGRRLIFRLIERMINLRSWFTGIATGDQGIFIEKSLFNTLGGFKEIPLMEDIDLSKRLRKVAGRPLCIKNKLTTSSRRWEKHGIIQTILLMWRLRLAYSLGTPAEQLAKHYSSHS